MEEEKEEEGFNESPYEAGTREEVDLSFPKNLFFHIFDFFLEITEAR